MVSSECPQDKACVRKKCIDPCPGTCGSNGRCQVVNHNPICSCPPGYNGDPFIRCFKERKYFYSTQTEQTEHLIFLENNINLNINVTHRTSTS